MFRWIVPAAAALCLAGYVFVYATGRASQPIRSDGFSYYVYLPSWFIYHDTTLTSVARDCCGGDYPAFTAIMDNVREMLGQVFQTKNAMAISLPGREGVKRRGDVGNFPIFSGPPKADTV